MNHTSILKNILAPIFVGAMSLAPFSAHAQSLPIAIDSQFDDWTSEALTLTDAQGDGNGIDLLSFKVANDESHLFIQLELAEEINLTESHKLTLYLDTDLDNNTGTGINGIGADLELRFGEREAFYKLPSGQGYLSLNELIFRHQPSVTSTLFEISLDLSALSNAGFPLYNANGVRLYFKDKTTGSGDAMPESGSIFTFMFDDSPTLPYESISLEKESGDAIRLLTWNTLHTGLDDFDRAPFFSKILNIVQPDIITFNECWDMNAAQAASFMNGAVPLPNFQSWKTVKLDQGNITASRYPILQNWVIYPGHRLTASLIDIPSSISSHDLLVINAHFRCCDNNYERQLEADAFVQFILDAKTPGGSIDLPEGTPFLLSGDLNLVGFSQQLTTLLTGDIVNNGTFGPGGPMDWDNGDLIDVISHHTNDRLAYTWRNDYSSYPPSRIDYQIISNTLEVEKTFTLEPLVMTNEQLNQYGLGKYDAAEASDHLPKATDLILPLPLSNASLEYFKNINLSPNPTSGEVLIEATATKPAAAEFTVVNTLGQLVYGFEEMLFQGANNVSIDLSTYPAGLYFVKMNTGDYTSIQSVIKK